ncbi:MAG: hypothetical protein JNK79_01800 [Chitinophagaceae bacterium]|nr:hypothetical protein [Chitinophagaceae bacterium]
MTDKNDPRQEGHTREWQDRARVVLDAKEAAKTAASPNQSPEPDERNNDVEENKRLEKREEEEDDPVY